MSFVPDCDYCGEISLCFEDKAGGTCCHSCDREDDHEDDHEDTILESEFFNFN